jgi:hypothetical protein
LELHATSFIERAHPPKVGAITAAEVIGTPLSCCKKTFKDERTNHLIIQNWTPHIDTKI